MIENNLGLIAAVCLGIVLLIIFPMYHIYETQDAMMQLHLVDEVDLFVNTIKSTGELKTYQYEQFVSSLNSFGVAFDVEITHKKRNLFPKYGDPNDASTFTGEVVTIYEEILTEEIIEEMYSNAHVGGGYSFDTGDIIVVSVVSHDKSRADKLREMLWHVSLDKPSFFTQFSGIIANETH